MERGVVREERGRGRAVEVDASACDLGRFVDGTFKGAEAVPLWYSRTRLEQASSTLHFSIQKLWQGTMKKWYVERTDSFTLTQGNGIGKLRYTTLPVRHS